MKLDAVKKLFSFAGRSERQEYWLVVFLPFLISLVGMFVLLTTTGIGTAALGEDPGSSNSIGSILFNLIFGLVVFVYAALMASTLWWSFAVFARRSRDMGVSPQWTWIYALTVLTSPFIIPAIAALVMFIVWGVRGSVPETVESTTDQIEPST